MEWRLTLFAWLALVTFLAATVLSEETGMSNVYSDWVFSAPQ